MKLVHYLGRLDSGEDKCVFSNTERLFQFK